MTKKDNFIWVFGENLGSTANNNSYYFWKHIVNIKDEIDKFIVFEKNESTKEVYNSLSEYEKKFVLWKNSKKHYQKYFNADLFFVTLSYKDIVPTKLLFKNMEMQLKKPLIYLQHGTIGMKMVYYRGDAYWNNMFKFFVFTDDEYEYLQEYNNIAEYQLYKAKYHPRYGELLRKDEKYTNKNQILWFITWREYFGINAETDLFISHVKHVIESEKMREYLKNNNKILKICVHQFFNEKAFGELYKLSQERLVEIVHPRDVDVMDELNKSELLITDYSSVGYDFTFLNRPVILFQPDLLRYSEEREFYCEIDELNKFNITRPNKLIKTIVNETYDLNPFFKKSFPDNIDYAAIKENKHIDRFYNEFKEMQTNKITFIGLDYYNPSGSVNKTMNIAESLMKKGYLVDAISLRKPAQINFKIPYGMNITSIYTENDPSRKNKLNYLMHSLGSNYSYFKHDYRKEMIHPYCGSYLKNYMKHTKAKTIVSTRESIHLFLNDCTSDYVENRLYIRNPNDYGGEGKSQKLLEEIKKRDLKNNILISKRDLDKFENELNINISDYKFLEHDIIVDTQISDIADLYNQVIDSEIIEVENEEDILKQRDKIEKELDELDLPYIPEKLRYIGMAIIDFNEKDSEEMTNIIEFGKYLKENNIRDIALDVLGKGDYSEYFLDLIEENDLFTFINYRGLNRNPAYEIRIHDFLLELSSNPRFNTNYFMATLNYKKVFCLRNNEANEILGDIPNSFIESFDELCEEIYKLPDLSLRELRENHEKIYEKSLKGDIGEEFLEMIK